MNITKFISFINEKNKTSLDASYYTYIDLWREYWKGNVSSFHTFKETGLDGAKHTRELFRMNMPKKACEDWASLLLNDKTTIALGDADSEKWLFGENQVGGLLKKLNFWPNANALVEKAFWSGTGAFVVNLRGMQIDGQNVIPSPDAEINIDYLDASCIIPLTVKHGRIVDVAFATDVMIRGQKLIYLQTHKLTNAGYVIENEFFSCEDEKVESPVYKNIEPEGFAKRFFTSSNIPLFAIFSPAVVKNIDGGTGLGMSVFSEALYAAKQVDTTFNNYHRDFYLGGKKVFYNKKLTQGYVTKSGEEITVAPDDVQQQLFYQSDDGCDIDGKRDIYEYNPSLRVEENSKAMQDALNYFSFKVGFGTHHYRFEHNGVKTATEYNGDRQDLVQNANKHQTQIENALIDVIRALLWAGKTVQGANVNIETDITINWDDSFIMDANTRRNIDKDDALSGFIPKWKYNVQWRGMNEEDAKAAVLEAQNESGASEQLGFGDI